MRLVNWADEEGARFGRSLFGSSAAAGSMADQAELALLQDRDGVALPDAVGAFGVTLEGASGVTGAARECGGVHRAAHRAGARARVDGAAARRRARHVRRRAVAIHVARPGGSRRLDADGQRGATRLPARRSSRSTIRDIAREVGDGAVCTSGGVVCRPGIVTSVVETAEQLLDQRHLDADSLARLLELAQEAADRFAAEENIEVEWERIWRSSRSCSTRR